MSSDNYTNKVWGYELLLHNAEFCVKRMGIDQGAECSIHLHAIKKEMFIVIKGAIRVELWNPVTALSGNEAIDLGKPDKVLVLEDKFSGAAVIYIDNLVPHRFIGLEKHNEFIEASTHDDPDDSFRFTKSRNPDNR